jgi:predicted AAA+ superfamily ATPase
MWVNREKLRRQIDTALRRSRIAALLGPRQCGKTACEGRRYGFACKCQDAPGTSRSMHIALAELRLEHLFVIYPGSKAYPLQEKISVVPLAQVESCRPAMSSRETR